MPFTSLARCFDRRQRISTTDDDGSIDRCERFIKTQDPGLASMRCKCEVHKTSGIIKKVMNVFANEVTFLLHVSLAIGFGSAMATMRDELRAVIRDNFDYQRAPPLADCRANLNSLLDVVAYMQVLVVQFRRAIVEALWTGDLQGPTATHFATDVAMIAHIA